MCGYFNGATLSKYDIVENQTTSMFLKKGNEFYSEYTAGIFANGGYVYIFYDGEYFFLKVNFDQGTIEEIPTNTACHKYQYANSYVSQLQTYDEVQGIIYLRTQGYCYPFQFTQEDVYSTGDIIVVQDVGYNNPVIILDDPEIQVGIHETYIQKAGGLDGNHMACWGDGEKWNVLKNPTGETCTLSYNLDGGTGTFPSQTVVCGTVPTAPSNVPTKSGAIFESWYLGNEPFDFSTPIAVDTTLTAHYLEYEEVSYIQSTGTQYIDTGVVGSIKNRIELDIQYVGDTSIFQINGLTYNSMRNDIGLNSSNVFWGVSTNGVTSTTPADNNRHTYFIDCTNGSYGMDNSTIGSVTPATVADLPYNVLLFARRNGQGNVEAYCYEKLYSAKYYVSGTLVRDFKPIQITSTGEYCLLDEVEHKLYRNAGSGEFIGEGWQPTYLDYIESTGTQYVDTGIVPKSTTKMVVDFAYTTSSTSSQLNGWGSSDSTEAFSFGVVGSSQTFYCYVTSNYTATFTNVPFDNNKHTFSLESGSQKLDSVEYGTNTIGSTAVSGQTMYLFAVHGEWQSTGGASYSNEKIYSCKIYDGNTLVRDFQPAFDYNNTPCLYDKITETFFYNLGSGTFNYGEVE